jgi:hypothetical protein
MDGNAWEIVWGELIVTAQEAGEIGVEGSCRFANGLARETEEVGKSAAGRAFAKALDSRPDRIH